MTTTPDPIYVQRYTLTSGSSLAGGTSEMMRSPSTVVKKERLSPRPSKKRSIETATSSSVASTADDDNGGDETKVYPFILRIKVDHLTRDQCPIFYNLRNLDVVVINEDGEPREKYLLKGKYADRWIEHLSADQSNAELMCDICTHMSTMVIEHEIKVIRSKSSSSSSSGSKSKKSRTTTFEKKESIQYKPQEMTVTTTTVVKEKNKKNKKKQDDEIEEHEIVQEMQQERAMVPVSSSNSRVMTYSPSSSYNNDFGNQLSRLCGILEEEQRQKNMLIEQNKTYQNQMIAINNALLSERSMLMSAASSQSSVSPYQQQIQYEEPRIANTTLQLKASPISAPQRQQEVYIPTNKSTSIVNNNRVHIESVNTAIIQQNEQPPLLPSPPPLPPRLYFAELDKALEDFNNGKKALSDEQCALFFRIEAIVHQQMANYLRRRVSEQPKDNEALVYDPTHHMVHVLSNGYFSLRYYLSLLTQKLEKDISGIYDIRIFLKKTSSLCRVGDNSAFIQAPSQYSPEFAFNTGNVMLNTVTMKLLYTFQVKGIVKIGANGFGDYIALLNNSLKKKEPTFIAEKKAEEMAILDIFPYPAEAFTSNFTLKRRRSPKTLTVKDSRQGWNKACQFCDNYTFVNHKQAGGGVKVFGETGHFKKTCIFDQKLLDKTDNVILPGCDMIALDFDALAKKVESIIKQYDTFYEENHLMDELNEEFPNIPFGTLYSSHLFYADGKKFQFSVQTKARVLTTTTTNTMESNNSSSGKTTKTKKMNKTKKTNNDATSTTKTINEPLPECEIEHLHPRLLFFKDGSEPIRQFEERVRLRRTEVIRKNNESNFYENDENAYRGFGYGTCHFGFNDEMNQFLHGQEQYEANGNEHTPLLLPPPITESAPNSGEEEGGGEEYNQENGEIVYDGNEDTGNVNQSYIQNYNNNNNNNVGSPMIFTDYNVVQNHGFDDDSNLPFGYGR